MKKLDLVLAWALVVLGFVDCGSALASFRGLAVPRTWFFIGGIAIVECGFLNLLRTSGGRGNARLASVISNVLLFLAFAGLSIFAMLDGHVMQSTMLILVLLMVGSEMLFSIR